MVRITKVHTGGGDRGETSLASGQRVSKAHPRVEFYGTIDELNSVIGMVLSEFNRMESHHNDGGARATVRTVRNGAVPKLGIIQQELFDIGGECSFMPDQVPEMMTVISQEQADRLCEEMDEWTNQLEPLESFILPAGSPLVSVIHLARTVARRAERNAVVLRDADGDGAIRDVVIAYLNRLSDWFFVLARWVSKTLGEDETLWIPLGKRVED
ncbi:MAG: cob(I)yrinic acid a,c-diamide adenosyltransferase [Candidatus Thermoplasmatota archaeon]|nr:cob(I)yrinic acid a,c-diamide adenosyltransferase [Candidatus Thermoplasmatota archaeon]